MLADKYRPSPFFPITSLQAQCFHALTHSLAQRRTAISFTDNMFRTLSIATGVVPPSLRSHSSRRSLRLDPSATQLAPEIDSRSLGPQSGKETHTNPLPSERPSPFNAVFRHSMHGNTVQRKVWSHAANSGKLFFVTEGLRGQSKWGP